MKIRLIYDDEEFVRMVSELDLPENMAEKLLNEDFPKLCTLFLGVYDEHCYYEIITDYTEYLVRLEEGSWGVWGKM